MKYSKVSKVLGFLAVAAAVLPAASHAQSGYVSKNVNLRAGPAREYPTVAILRAGMPISVQACLSDYQWCDVVAGPNRGWVYAGNIVYPYQGANVPVLTYGAVLGLGIVAFSVGSYWDHHYQGRPWYPQRQRWINRPGPQFVPGGHRPMPAPGFAPGGHRPPAPGFAPGPHRPQPVAPAARPGNHMQPQPAPAGGPGGHRRTPQDHSPGNR